MPNLAAGRRPVLVLGDAAFLSCSWLWCIGMFLPYWLAADYGRWSWVAFATPNVIGAAALGFVLTRRGAASLVSRHAPAMRVFSAWTVVFHAWFVAWFARWVFAGTAAGGVPLDAAMIGAFFVLTALCSALPERLHGGAALAVLVISALCAAGAAMTSGASPAFALPPVEGEEGPAALAFAACALAMGFLLCPPMDLTLNRVRRGTEHPRLVFGLGFGVLFLGLILMTLGYAGALIEHGFLSWYVAGHIAVQAAFTSGVHIRAATRPTPGVASAPALDLPASWLTAPRRVVLSGGLALAMFAAALVGVLIVGRGRPIYDTLLFAYAAPFPAYVWCRCVPWGLSPRAQWWALAGALAAATFGGPRWWFAAACGAVLIAPIAAVGLSRGAGGAGGAGAPA